MELKAEVETFWQDYLDSLPPGQRKTDSYTAWYFGNNPRLANELGGLVTQGTKTATCSLLYEYEEEGEGDRSLEYWRQAHWNYFSPICTALGREASEDMPLVCERFRLVYRRPNK